LANEVRETIDSLQIMLKCVASWWFAEKAFFRDDCEK